MACYRISRAAANMATRCFAGELGPQGYVFIAMSPGWVATDMGSAGGRTAPLTPHVSMNKERYYFPGGCVFLDVDFVWLTTPAEGPHGAHVQGAKRNRIDRRPRVICL